MMMPVLPDGFGSGSFVFLICRVSSLCLALFFLCFLGFFFLVFACVPLFLLLFSSPVLGLFVPLFFLGFSPGFYLSFPFFFSPKIPLLSPLSIPGFSSFFSLVFFPFPLRFCPFFSSSPVRIPSLAFIVGEWHPSPLVMKTQDCYCRSNEGMRIVQCPFLV